MTHFRRPDGAPGGDARWHELVEGETVEGTVVRLPMWGADAGTRLFLDTDDEVISIPATAGKGHTVLERLLSDERVRVGDGVTITYVGKRRTADGERTYRDYQLEVRCRAPRRSSTSASEITPRRGSRTSVVSDDGVER